MVKELTSESFEQEVLQSDIPVVVDFWAPWCGPCKAMAPIFDEVSQSFEGKVKFAKVNVDENQELAQQYGVMSIPTLAVFKNGEKADTWVGMHEKDQLKQKVEQLTSQE